jgi:hypothetical protein
MNGEIFDLLTSIAAAKSRGETVAEIVERWASDHQIDLDQLGRRARRSFCNRIEAAALSTAAAVARAAQVISEAPRNEENWK